VPIDRGGLQPFVFFALDSAYGDPCSLRGWWRVPRSGLAVIFDVVYTTSATTTARSITSTRNPTERGIAISERSDTLGMAPAFWRQGIRDFFLANMAMY